jgi:acyl transferase domain-containing protein/NADPH:quinone reductase-like Zn-dependent oxidoreductase/predicted O-methyltransferase YrrM/acyl carrier protein
MTASPLQIAGQAISALRNRLDAAEAEVLSLRRGGTGLVDVLGLGLRLPGGIRSASDFWQMLVAAGDVTSEVPASRVGFAPALSGLHAEGAVHSMRGGWLDRVDGFDAGFWGISPREVAGMDPQQRLLLECAWEALEDAALDPARLRGRRVGVYVGICGSDYAQLAVASGLGSIDAYHASGTQHSVASGRLSYALGLRGPSVSVDTACSSSLVAVHLALRALRSGECDLALVGGVNLMLAPTHSVGFSRAGMLSPDGRCKTFSSRADGYGRAEGCAVVVLGLADAAGRHGAWATLRGSALGQDGASGGLTVPNGPAQAEVIRAALADAGLDARSGAGAVGYVEAHGTGTALGDPIEAGALSEVFGASGVLVGSAKANMGHAEGAAGLVGLVKAVLVRHHGIVPPHPFADEPTGHVDWGSSGLRLPLDAEALGAEALIGVSSFGFSGTNAHVVVGPARDDGRHTPAPDSGDATRPGVFVVSARSAAALSGAVDAAASHVAGLSGAAWSGACWTAVAGRASMRYRRAVVAWDGASAAALLRAGSGAGSFAADCAGSGAPLIWLFTGQGGGLAGAGAGLLATEPAFAAAWHAACDAFDPHLAPGAVGLHVAVHGLDAAAWLSRPGMAQAAHVALGVALAALWRSRGLVPSVVVGHSLGEYVAAHVAGVLPLAALARLVAGRGQLCAGLPPGGMAASTAPSAAVEAAVRTLPAWLADEVGLAACHGQAGSTVSGSEAGLAALCSVLDALGHASTRLAGDHGYHSALMAGAVAPLSALAGSVAHAPLQIALASTLTGTVLMPGVAQDWAAHWGRHLREPVRYANALAAALRHVGCDVDGTGAVALELGPEPTLSRLTRRVAPSLVGLPSLQPGTPDPVSMAQATAALWTQGLAPDWATVQPQPHHFVPLPSYHWDRQHHWLTQAPTAQGQPLLGTRQPGPGPAIRYLARFDPAEQKILTEHRVDGVSVLPGAAMVQMAQQAAALRWPGVTMGIVDVGFELPLSLAAAMAVQLTLTADEAGGSWDIHAVPDQDVAAPDTVWVRHATGRCTASPTKQRTETPSPSGLSPTTGFYAALAASGIHLGGPFQGLRCFALRDDTVMAQVEVPEEGPLAPLLRLDAALQAVALLAPERLPLVPVTIGGIDLAELPASFWLKAKRVPTHDDDVVADIALWSNAGSLGVIEGVRLRRLAPQDALSGHAWLVAWRDLAQPPAIASVEASDGPALLARLGTMPRHATILRDLERRAACYAAAALVTLGMPEYPGAAVPSPAALGIAPRHRQLVERMLAMLQQDGVLVREGGALRVGVLPRAVGPGPDGPEAALLDAFGRALPALLRGEADPLALLFGDGAAARVHRDSLWSQPLSAQLAASAMTLLRGVTAPRVLEIGAGTGGTTAALLPLLPADATYVFTDVASGLLSDAAARLSRLGFSVRRLDIEQDPEEQGFTSGSFDLVVAANALHATRDIATTLLHVRRLLAPGGTLALAECTAPPRWGDLTFGLTEGWWRFTDPSVRSIAPMLDTGAWRRALTAAGFGEAGVLDAGATPWQQAIILARPEPISGHWLLLGEAMGFDLAGALLRAGCGVTCLPIGSDAAAIGVVLDAHAILAGIVHLGALAVTADDDPMLGQALVCAPALALVAALVAADRAVPLWLITRGAVDTDRDGGPSAGQAALWGLGRTCRLEHPELTPRLVDVDAAPAAAEALVDVLQNPGAEWQLALRGARRLVARLVYEAGAAPLPPGVRVTGSPGPGEVDIAIRAAGVNFRDALIGFGAYPDPDATPGIEALGIVEAVGHGVYAIGVGDRVLAIGPGAFGSRMRTNAALVAPVPDGSVAMAGLPVAYLTAAWTLRHLARVRPGQRVMIHAATGGTGLAALHVARAAGAEIVAVASSGKHAMLRRLGIRTILDSRDPASIAASGSVDVVLSALGVATGRASLDQLRHGGCFIELGAMDALTAEMVAACRPDVRFEAVNLSHDMQTVPHCLGPVLRDVLAEIEAGLLPPLPVVRMGHDTRALRRLRTARFPGKLVVSASPTEGTVLITGAFGGLGLLLAEHLAGRGVRHLVLAGRGVPQPAALAGIAALRAAGVRVRVLILDVTDDRAVKRLLDEIDAGPVPLGGVVHAAGIVADSMLAAGDWVQFEQVLTPKLAGGWALHQATEDRVLDFFVLCSSGAGTLGNAGQAAHAAANAGLDALAQYRQSLGLPGISIAWGPWAGTGHAVSDFVERHLAARGLLAFSPAQGVAAFGAALGAAHPHLAVMRLDWTLLRAFRGADPFLAEGPNAAAGPPVAAASMSGGPATLSREAIGVRVRDALVAVLGLSGSGAIDPTRLFFDQGMDSLTSIEFRNRLQTDLGRKLPTSLALDYPTVERLVAHLSGDDVRATADIDTLDEDELAAALDARLDRVLAL